MKSMRSWKRHCWRQTVKKAFLLPFTNLKEFPFFNGYMSIEAYYDAGTDDIPWDTMVVQTDEGKYRISVPKVLKDDF